MLRASHTNANHSGVHVHTADDNRPHTYSSTTDRTKCRLRLVHGQRVRWNQWELEHEGLTCTVQILLPHGTIDHVYVWKKRAALF